MVGVDDLKVLFQPKQFYDSLILSLLLVCNSIKLERHSQQVVSWTSLQGGGSSGLFIETVKKREGEHGDTLQRR